MRNYKNKSAGFTLIELIVTLSVAAILLTVAAPSFIAFQRNSELTSLANRLLSSINTARGEAMKYGRNTMITPNIGNIWNNGWIVYIDINSNNSYDSKIDILLHQEQAVPEYISIEGNNNASASSPYISFNSSGFARSIGSGLSNLTFSIKRNDVGNNEQVRLLKIARTGRARICTPTTTDCNFTTGN